MTIGRASQGSASSTDASELYNYIQAAASLRLEIAAFENDQQLIKGGTRLVYCVDTNIVNLYLQPEKMGPGNADGGGRYGVVFPSDPRELSVALAAALSRYIFFDLGHKDGDEALPLVLLLGHDAEVRHTYDILSKSYETELESISHRRNRLRHIVRDIANGSRNPLEFENDIYDLLYGSTNNAEQFNRINRLITSRRLGRLTSLISQIAEKMASETVPAHVFREALSVPNTIREKIEESARRNWWRKELSKAAPRRQAGRLHVDACALARLEMVNRRLARLDACLVLITGDEAMHDVAKRHRVDEEGEDRESFAFRYLRHPRAFLASTTILARTDLQSANAAVDPTFTSDWLEPLLSNYMRQGGPALKDLREFASNRRTSSIPASIQEAATRHPAIVDELAKEWLDHASLVRQQHSISSEQARGEIRRVLGAVTLEDVRPALERLDDELVKKSETTWQSFFGAVAHAGFDIALSRASRPRSRVKNAPAIAFDSFPATSRFVRRALSREPQYDLRDDLESSLADIEQEDSFHYAKILAYSILFAADGNWYVSKVLALRAIEISKLINKDSLRKSSQTPGQEGRLRLEQAPRISGREAYYCAAVSSRNTALSPDDLTISASYLDKSYDLLNLDQVRDEPTSVTSLRFDAERQANSLTRILFNVFSKRRTDVITYASDLSSIMCSLKAIVTAAEDIQDSFMRINVKRTSLTNLFMCLALLEHQNVEPRSNSSTQVGALHNADLEPWVAAFLANVDDSGVTQIYVTDLVEAMSLYVRARFRSARKNDARMIRERLDSFELQWNRDKSQLMPMPYDENRFIFIIEAARRAVGSLAERGGDH